MKKKDAANLEADRSEKESTNKRPDSREPDIKLPEAASLPAEELEKAESDTHTVTDAELAERKRRATRGIGETAFVVGGTMAFLCGMLLYFFTDIYYNGVATDVLKAGAMKHALSSLWVTEILSVVVMIAGIIVAVVKCGSRDEERRIRLNWFDRIFGELRIIAAACASWALLGSGELFWSWMCSAPAVKEFALKFVGGSADKLASISDVSGDIISFDPPWVLLLFAAAIALAVLAFDIFVVESLARTIKDHSFWKHTLIGTIWFHIYESGRKKEWSLAFVMAIIFAAMLLSSGVFGFIAVAAAVIYFIPKWFRKYSDIRRGLKEVKNGNLDYKIPVRGNGELERLAADINDIAGAQKLAMENELKTQRLKSELISNVSHDLKTPLTSMVTYVDLLKAEGLDSERAPEYLKVIDEKTARLQELTENLFEAAKASSGDIPVSMNRIEMNSIVNQAIAELEENLAVNDIDMIFDMKSEEIYVMADGKLLWRVIENLITNISKYALPGSRAYMDIRETDSTAILEVKNISRDPLNISADELMERFKRGDESRNTSGSGLGLAIAKDLTTLMKGKFDLHIDGDLFKATVELRKPEEQVPDEDSVVYV